MMVVISIKNEIIMICLKKLKKYMASKNNICPPSRGHTWRAFKFIRKNMDIVHLKYWKRYLQVPKCSSTKITYLLSGTCPLSETMFKNPTRQLQTINLSIPLPGHQLNLVRNKAEQEEEFSFQLEVPEKFWQILQEQIKLPANIFHRRKFTSKLYDLKHKNLCNRNKNKKDFHNYADPSKCKCKNCNESMNWYHECQSILDTVGANVSNVAS